MSQPDATVAAASGAPTLWQSLLALRDGRLWRIFLLGIASGFPWLLIGSAMTAWLKDEGLSRSAIGLFGSIFIVYTFNFLWAPLIDHVRLPLLGRLGQRRSWVVLCLGLLVVLTCLLAATGPGFSVAATVAIAFAIAIASATQDLAIDAYRITIIRRDEPELIGHAAAMATCGWWTGASVPGMAAFWLADAAGWPLVYLGLAAVPLAIAAVVPLILAEPARAAVASTDLGPGLPRWLSAVARALLVYFDALAEFFRRNGIRLALGLLAFIFLFKLGEAFLGRMAIVFYKEVGFSDAEIGTYSKGIGWLVTIACSLAAGALAGRFGAVRGLLVAGVAMASTNLLFSWLAVAGPEPWLLVVAVLADGITAAFATVAFVAFITFYTSHLHAATQYGALASLANSGRTLVAASSGVLVDSLGGDWALFFALTALMVAPSLAILAWIARGIGR